MWDMRCRAEVIAHRSRQLEPRANASAKAGAGSGGDRVWGCGDAGDAGDAVKRPDLGDRLWGIRASGG